MGIMEVKLHTFYTCALNGGECGLFAPGKQRLLPTYRKHRGAQVRSGHSSVVKKNPSRLLKR
jgi:hypothetical protein